MNDVVSGCHAVAYALYALRIPRVQRSTLRALLPDGLPSQSQNGNAVSRKFKEWLSRLELKRGLIERQGTFVNVVDRAALWRYVENGLRPRPGTEDQPKGCAAVPLLDLVAAVRHIQAEIRDDPTATDEIAEARRRELLAIQRLMTAPPGVITGERGIVRIVPKGRAL